MSNSPSLPFTFNIIPYLIGGIFLLVFGTLAYAIVAGISRWMSDNASPVETLEAQVIAKRDKTTVSDRSNSTTYFPSGTTYHTYFATFEYANAQRREFHIGESEYGVLMEGDRGTLTFQGSRYKSFARHT